MDTRIPWYYMWSPHYEIFHRIFQDKFHESLRLPNEFNDRPIYIEQSVFKNELHDTNGIHPFVGCTIKVDLLIQAIYNNWNGYFLFSDIDILIKNDSIREDIDIFIQKEYDMVFLKEDKTVNIGFCLIKANEKTLKFWKDVLSKITKEAHDQSVVNDELPLFDGLWGFFDEKIYVLSNYINLENIHKIKICQFLSSCNGSETDMCEKLLGIKYFCNLDIYSHLIPQYVKNLNL